LKGSQEAALCKKGLEGKLDNAVAPMSRRRVSVRRQGSFGAIKLQDGPGGRLDA
jgi:hypothetical protein